MIIKISDETDFKNYLLDTSNSLYNINNDYYLDGTIDWNLIEYQFRKPIINFSGTFDGSNNILKNFFFDSSDIENYSFFGMFGNTYDSTIKNLIIQVNGKFIKRSNTGILIGRGRNVNLLNCKLEGIFNFTSNDFYTCHIGIIAGKLEKSKVENFYVNILEGILYGDNQVGGFIGYSKNNEIENVKLCGNVNIISSCNFNFEEVKTLDILFYEYFDDFDTNIIVREHYNILKNYYNYYTFLKLNQSDFYKYKFPLEYVFKYLDMILKENNVKTTGVNLDIKNNIGGFIGYDENSSINNSEVNYKGNINGFNNISGFIGKSVKSIISNCCMQFKGNINGLSDISLFCSETQDSIFTNCQVNKFTLLNNILVKFSNFNLFNKIGDSEYKVTFKKNAYPESFYEFINFKNSLLSNKHNIFNIFDDILTYDQIKKLSISKIELNSLSVKLKNLNELLSKKWEDLSEDQQIKFSRLNIDKIEFNYKRYPDSKWDDFNNIEKEIAYSLGFSKSIWDEKLYVSNKYDPDLIQYLNFQINLPDMILNLPLYFKEFLLIKIKEYIYNILNKNVELTNIKIYNTSNDYIYNKNFDIMIILSNTIKLNEIDDACVITDQDLYYYICNLKEYFEENYSEYDLVFTGDNLLTDLSNTLYDSSSILRVEDELMIDLSDNLYDISNISSSNIINIEDEFYNQLPIDIKIAVKNINDRSMNEKLSFNNQNNGKNIFLGLHKLSLIKNDSAIIEILNKNNYGSIFFPDEKFVCFGEDTSGLEVFTYLQQNDTENNEETEDEDTVDEDEETVNEETVDEETVDEETVDEETVDEDEETVDEDEETVDEDEETVDEVEETFEEKNVPICNTNLNCLLALLKSQSHKKIKKKTISSKKSGSFNNGFCSISCAF